MTDENRQAQILYTQYHRAYFRDNSNCDEVDVWSFQIRLHAVEKIRLIQFGLIEPTKQVVQNLKNLNEHLRDFKKPELPLDFLN